MLVKPKELKNLALSMPDDPVVEKIEYVDFDTYGYKQEWDYAMHDDCPYGWRIPTIRELESLVDYSTYSPALIWDVVGLFPHLPKCIWSSTECAWNKGKAWYIDVKNGYTSYTKKDQKFDVLWVREVV